MSRRSLGRFGIASLAAALLIPENHAIAQRAAERAGASNTPSRLLVISSSALVPGTGQLIMHQRRGAAFLALEAVGIGLYVSQTRDGRRERANYRRISRTVARAAFDPNGPSGDWDYYERMEKFVASGAFDSEPGGALDPELDVETFNGAMWLLARQTYWRDPEVVPPSESVEYQAALKFYTERAVGSEMRWSWVGAPEPFQKFRASIDASNSAFRSAGATASVLLANHFLSAIDAWISIHARVHRASNGSLWVTGTLPLRY